MKNTKEDSDNYFFTNCYIYCYNFCGTSLLLKILFNFHYKRHLYEIYMILGNCLKTHTNILKLTEIFIYIITLLYVMKPEKF